MDVSLDNLKQHLDRHYDVFLASASYEIRSLSIINAIDNDIRFEHKLVSLSAPHKALIRENLNVFKEKGFSIIEIDNTKQIETANNLINHINQILEFNSNSSFLIDITAFTRQTLLILIKILRFSLSKDNKVQFLYTPAKEYSVGLPYREKWLTKGIVEVNSVLGYSGIIRPSRPYHLIILMGYEVERASSLINAYEPSKITIGYAREIDSISDHYELNKQKFDELLAEFPHAEAFEFSCVNVSNYKADILKQTLKHKGYNVIISPMNNKISTVACALAAFDNDEVQLAIAIPAVYNYENYSIPGDCCHLIEMPNLV